MAAGLLLAAFVRTPWQLYLTLGAAVGGGVNCLAYTAQSLYLTNWFVRRRGLALSIAFSGVGLGSIVLLPWQQSLIAEAGWRTACIALGLLVLCLLAPLNLLLRHRPEDLGLAPDGAAPAASAAARSANIVDRSWAAIDWTLARALRTARFWWLAAGYFGALFSWYAVQVHQTKYLTEIGFGAGERLGAGAGQPGRGAGADRARPPVDRIGREWVWTIGNAGFVLCCVALLLLRAHPAALLLWAMIVAQGTLGYSLTALLGPIPAEIFEGRHFGSIFGMVVLAAVLGGAAGPWTAGAVHDAPAVTPRRGGSRSAAARSRPARSGWRRPARCAPLPAAFRGSPISRRSPRQRPAVAARVGAGAEHAGGGVAADDLDAARAFEIADRIDRMAAPRQIAPHHFGEAPLHRQHVRAVMRIIRVLAGHHRGPARQSRRPAAGRGRNRPSRSAPGN